jgi:hypothetical protein
MKQKDVTSPDIRDSTSALLDTYTYAGHSEKIYRNAHNKTLLSHPSRDFIQRS